MSSLKSSFPDTLIFLMKGMQRLLWTGTTKCFCEVHNSSLGIKKMQLLMMLFLSEEGVLLVKTWCLLTFHGTY